MRYDALVVGAGPVGSVTAGYLAKEGHSVILLEEHRTIGKPMQCGGMVSPRIHDLVDFSFSVQNKVRGAYVHSPDGAEFMIRAKQDRGIVLDRTEFDERASQWAAEQGATIRLGSRVKRLLIGGGPDRKRSLDPTGREGNGGSRGESGNGSKGGSKRGSKGGVKAIMADGSTITADLVLGADGPYSITARCAGLPPIREIISGYEIEAIGTPRDLDMVEVFTGQKVGRGFFSWVIPYGEDHMRIGTGVRSPKENAFRSFHHLMKGPLFSSRFKDVQPISIHGGGIPVGMRERMTSDRVLVLGDAAGLAKPVSGGGVITGLISARIGARVASDCITNERYSARDLAPYQKKLMAEVGKELKRAWKLRKTFMYLSDQELEKLFTLLTRPEVLHVINEKGDIDYPGRTSVELLKASPGLLRFAFRYLGSSLLSTGV